MDVAEAKHLRKEEPEEQRGRRPLAYLIPLACALIAEVVFFNLGFWAGLFSGQGPAFEIVPIRLAIELAVAYIIFAFWPTSRIYRWRLGESRFHIAIIILVVAIHALTFIAVTQHIDSDHFFTAGETKFDGAVYDDGQQYAYLADSIIEGRTWLDLDVPDWLAEMDNPYDAEERFRLAAETGEPFYWDFAFYDGHYYCYFGVLPALVAFVPFKLITGTDLRTDFAVAFFCVLLSIAIALFLYRFMRRYFPNSSLGAYLLAFIMFAMGAGILTQAFYPLFYSLPPLAGLSCIFFGFTAWVSARRPDGSLSKLMLVLGALLVAGTLACRPQMFLAFFIAIPLFWREIAEERVFFSKRGIANTLAVIVPCLAVAALVMLYNKARFGSFMDFGAAYNLTGFDMTAKSGGIDPLAIGAALFFYILMPPYLSGSFPFMQPVIWYGDIHVEPFYGGFFAFTPAAIAIVGIVHFRKDLKGRRLFGVCIGCIVVALVLMLMSAQVASISMRYFSDFAWALTIPALCVWLAWMDKAQGNRKRLLIAIALFAALVLFGEFLSYWNLLADGRYGEMIYMNPNVYGTIASWFGA